MSDVAAMQAADALQAQWAGRERFVVLDADPDCMRRLLQIASVWRVDPRRSARLHCLALVPFMPGTDELRRQLEVMPAASAELRDELVARWPAATPDLHRLELEGGQLQWLVIPGAVELTLRQLVAEVDAFLLGAELPSTRLPKSLARLAVPGASLHAVSSTPALRRGLETAGFELIRNDGGAPVAPALAVVPTLQAHYAPRFATRRPAGREPVTTHPLREAVVIGAGLAGCAAAEALAALGWRCTVVDRHASPAAEASGNPAGVFHGVVHTGDGPHARFNRAAALEATRAYRELLQHSDERIGAVDGLLRVGTALPDLAAMQRLLCELGLPPDHVQALDAAAASRLAGLVINQPAWFYPGGGWMRPALVARAWLQRAQLRGCRFVAATVARIERSANGRWQLCDAAGAAIASAPLLVLANADGARSLLRQLATEHGGDRQSLDGVELPLQRVRGQLTALPHEARQPAPCLPLSGAGYLLPPMDGQLIFGATAQPEDEDPTLRAADQHQNLARLARLSPALAGYADAEAVRSPAGRTAWRSVAEDRLPLVGAVPTCWTGQPASRADQPRQVEREPGLMLLSGLGSRGLTWAPLAAKVLAALADGAPVPLPASLIDAVDPARFASRATRRGAAQANAAMASD